MDGEDSKEAQHVKPRGMKWYGSMVGVIPWSVAGGHLSGDTMAHESLDKLEKTARRMPQPYEFDLGHTDGIRHADLDAGVRVLNGVIYECQRSLEEIEHARLDLDARGWARARGLRE